MSPPCTLHRAYHSVRLARRAQWHSGNRRNRCNRCNRTHCHRRGPRPTRANERRRVCAISRFSCFIRHMRYVRYMRYVHQQVLLFHPSHALRSFHALRSLHALRALHALHSCAIGRSLEISICRRVASARRPHLHVWRLSSALPSRPVHLAQVCGSTLARLLCEYRLACEQPTAPTCRYTAHPVHAR